jgi:hypothetical protein
MVDDAAGVGILEIDADREDVPAPGLVVDDTAREVGPGLHGAGRLLGVRHENPRLMLIAWDHDIASGARAHHL